MKELAVIERAKELVPGFRDGFSRFKQRIVLDQMSPSLLVNYGRYVAHAALHFGKTPEQISVEEMNLYLYRLSIEEEYSGTFFKFTVYGMRYWYLLYGLEDTALKMPVIRKKSPLSNREKPTYIEIAKEQLGIDLEQCPCCKSGRMITILQFPAHAPPFSIHSNYKALKIKNEPC